MALAVDLWIEVDKRLAKCVVERISVAGAGWWGVWGEGSEVTGDVACLGEGKSGEGNEGSRGEGGCYRRGGVVERADEGSHLELSFIVLPSFPRVPSSPALQAAAAEKSR